MCMRFRYSFLSVLAIVTFVAAEGDMRAQERSVSLSASDSFLIETRVPRLALVVGVENYENLDHVTNALNDAKELSSVLTSIGFSFVRYLPDPKRDDIYDYVGELAKRGGDTRQPAILVFFFAGHGFQNGERFNYIVPVGARKDHMLDDSIPVETILHSLATHRAGLAIAFFDSCRTGLSGQVGNINQVGFAELGSPAGAIVGLAAEFGSQALSAAHDGDADSPYTTALLRHLPRQSLSLDAALDKVQEDVKLATNRTQISFEVKGANGTGFYFVPGRSEQETEREKWESVIATGSLECAQRYVDAHPGSLFLQAALNWMTTEPHNQLARGDNSCPDD